MVSLHEFAAIGGTSKTGKQSADVELYRIKEDKWYTLPFIPVEMDDKRVVVMKNALYALGSEGNE